MGGLFEGLEKLGFKKIKEEEIFAMNNQRNKEEEAKQAKIAEEKKEEEYLFEKRYSCPIYFFSFAHKNGLLFCFYNLNELFNETIRLNTRCSGRESLLSTQKNPFLTN